LGVTFQEPFVAVGVADDQGNICGASVFNDFYKGGNVEFTHVGPGTLNRGIIRELVRYCFKQLKVTRVTAKTKRSNKLVRTILPRVGFVFEVTQKRYFGPSRGDDALVFVMTRENAKRWMNE